MLRSLLVPTAVLASVLILGCDQPAPSEPAAIPRPSLRTEQNPDGPGAVVFRFNDRQVIGLPDQGRGLTAVLGLTPQELEEFLAACPNPVAPEEIPTQIVLRPGDVVKLLAKGEVGVIIWPAVIFDICAEAEELPPILAAGTLRFIESVSDFNLSLTRANAVVLHAHGTVTDLVTGQEFRLRLSTHFVVGPDFKFFNAVRFDVILTPTRS